MNVIKHIIIRRDGAGGLWLWKTSVCLSRYNVEMASQLITYGVSRLVCKNHQMYVDCWGKAVYRRKELDYHQQTVAEFEPAPASVISSLPTRLLQCSKVHRVTTSRTDIMITGLMYVTVTSNVTLENKKVKSYYQQHYCCIELWMADSAAAASHHQLTVFISVLWKSYKSTHKRIKAMRHTSRSQASQRAIDEARTLILNLPKSGSSSKSKIVVFLNNT